MYDYWDDEQYYLEHEGTPGITVAKSALQGYGLHATRALPRGYDVGVLSRIYPRWFRDTSMGQYINHSYTPNVELYIIEHPDYVEVCGRLNQPVSSGTELTADYSDPLAPKPNFIAKD